MTVGSLFSGIGGLELGLELCGLGPVLWQVESDEFCRQVLARHWPGAARTVHDVRDASRHNLASVDVLCGGFPCQPVSLAGQRKARNDDRWLWPEYARIVGELRPRFVFVENVPGLLTADQGRAFGDVLGALATLGYDAVWDCFRASDVGAPHKRERIFLLAYRHGDGQPQPEGSHGTERRWALNGSEVHMADTDDSRPEGPDAGGMRGGIGAALAGGQGRSVAGALRSTQQRGQPIGVQGSAFSSVAREAGAAPNADSRVRASGCAVGGAFTRPAGGRIAQPGLGGVSYGLPGGLDGPRWPAGRGEPQHAREPPRTAKGVNRPGRLKALGNAVVPAQAALAWRVLLARVAGDES